MSDSTPAAASRSNRILVIVLLAIVTAVALLPWWRNRGYVRSFYDYGVVIGGAGRLDAGQKPYVDFIVPIQTGWFFFNWAAEKIAGGTFQAMTWSAVGCTVLATFTLGGMLARRWPWWAAGIVTSCIVWATVSQHTILWYNPWGVVLLTIVGWGAGLAPVLRRETAGWHALVAVALFLGGVNKVNMQVMAIGIAAGWLVRVALLGRVTGGRAAATAGFLLLFGAVLPVLTEMVWTGASFEVWWHNVITQVAGDRSRMMVGGLHWKFLLRPAHDYYEPLRLPWVGLAGVLLTLATTIGLLRHVKGEKPGLERALVVACAIIAYFGGELLLTTNMDIAYTALGGWLGLLVALWLGFGAPARGGWFYGGLVLPALVIGLVSWEAAWRGQRSQFGYSRAPRSEYRSADEAAPVYGYFRGTHVPPENFRAMRALAEWRAALPPEREKTILYAAGTDWAAHIWPALHTPELPLWIAGGYQFGEREYVATRKAIASGEHKEITVAKVLDDWKPELATLLRVKYRRRPLEWVFFHYSRAEGDGFSPDPIYFRQNFGGSTDARVIQSGAAIFTGAEGRLFLGTREGKETMRVTVPTNRLRGEVVVRRIDPSYRGPLAANFNIWAEYDANQRYPRWSQRVELLAGQDEVTAEYSIDSSHMVSLQEVEIPAEFSGKVAAGWRGPVIMHAGEDGPAEPRWLQPYDATVWTLNGGEIAGLFPANTPWLPARMAVRNGRVIGNQIELEPGGEVWLRVTGFVPEMVGTASIHPDRGIGRFPPVFRCGWIKDGRLEIFTQDSFSEKQREAGFRTWSAEPGGWIFITSDYIENGPAITLRFDRLLHRENP